MADMLRNHSTRYYRMCACCAGNKQLSLKPGPRERHQARAVEKRQWKKETQED